MKFLNAIFWEFVQNLPVILFFVAAVWLWAQQQRGKALLCVLMGAVTGALVIRFTEPLATGYEEPWGVTIVNIISFGVLQVPFIVYLSVETHWSSWRTDALLGGLAGVGLAVVQGLASQGSPLIGIVLHSVALAVASMAILAGIRRLKDRTLASAIVGAGLIAVVMTLIISVIDYSYLLLGVQVTP